MFLPSAWPGSLALPPTSRYGRSVLALIQNIRCERRGYVTTWLVMDIDELLISVIALEVVLKWHEVHCLILGVWSHYAFRLIIWPKWARDRSWERVLSALKRHIRLVVRWPHGVFPMLCSLGHKICFVDFKRLLFKVVHRSTVSGRAILLRIPYSRNVHVKTSGLRWGYRILLRGKRPFI